MFRKASHLSVCNLTVKYEFKQESCLCRYLSKRQHHWGRTILDKDCTLLSRLSHAYLRISSLSFRKNATDPALDPPATKHLKSQDWDGLSCFYISVSHLSQISHVFSFFSPLGIICVYNSNKGSDYKSLWSTWDQVVRVSRHMSAYFLKTKKCARPEVISAIEQVCVQRNGQRRRVVGSLHNRVTISNNLQSFCGIKRL